MRKITATVVALGIVVLGATACGHGSTPDSWVQGQQQAAQGTTAPLVDPYTSTGVWSVPDEIATGTYAVTAGTGPVTSLRWVEGCLDRWCQHPDDPVTAYAPDGPGKVYITFGPNDKAVQNNGVVLTKVSE